MLFLLVLTAVTICFTVSENSETKQRIASLVVLPPLVLGYDELYHESTETDKKAAPVKREPPAAPVRNKEPPAASVNNKKLPAASVNNKKPLVAPVKNKQPLADPANNKKPPAAPVNNKKPPATAVNNKKPPVAPVNNKKPPAAPVNNKKPGNTKKPQRTVILDTKGRRNFRRNYRSFLKKMKKNKQRAV